MGTCNWEFIPSEWVDNFGVEAIPTDTRECPKDALPGERRCKYHIDINQIDDPPLTEEEAFCDLLQESESVFGARFQSIHLSGDDIDIDPGENIQLQNVVVSTELELRDINSKFNWIIENCVFTRLSVRNAQINRPMTFQSCRFKLYNKFTQVNSTEGLSINNSVFDSLAVNGEFGDRVDLSGCEFRGSTAIFESEFDTGLNLNQTVFRDDFVVRNVDIQRTLDLKNSDTGDRAYFIDSDLAEVDTYFETSNKTIVIFWDSYIDHGILNQPTGSTTYFDLKDAELGDVQIPKTVDLSQYNFDETRFDGFKFYDHRRLFKSAGQNGWIFHQRWRIHEFEIDVPDSYYREVENKGDTITPRSPNYQKMSNGLKDNEETYLLAQKGATDQGDNTAASRLHIVRMKSKKERYKHSALWSESRSVLGKCLDLISYIKNQFHRITSLYGERPRRTIGLAILVIVLWAGMIAILGGITRSDGQTISLASAHQNSNLNLITMAILSIYFSLSAFTTLVYGNLAPASFPVEILSSMESFIGAFLIALFVFTLGRQINR